MHTTTTVGPETIRDTRTTMRLLVLQSPGSRATGRARVMLPLGGVILGRSGDERLQLEPEDMRMSREHARIEPADVGLQIKDLGSKNGTFVNGKRIETQPLRGGDVVRVGDHLLLFQELDSTHVQSLLTEDQWIGPLVGTSPHVATLRTELARLALLETPLLILGETGAGKDVAANYLHEYRTRQDGGPRPFVPVNCAALSPELAEAELFGQVKGAFTGAVGDREGLIREAQGGTLFLDELGEMSMGIQAKMLRAIENSEVRPVGSARSIQVETRIVAATNRELEEAIEQGRFRADLFARLMTDVITIPPLRERRDDVLPLLAYFLSNDGGAPLEFTANAAEALLCYRWPRNTRELRQLALRLGSESRPQGTVHLESLPEEIRQPFSRPGNDTAPVISSEEFRRATLLEIPRDEVPSREDLKLVLQSCNGNISRVAEFFRKDGRQVYRWCTRHGISTEEARANEDSPES